MLQQLWNILDIKMCLPQCYSQYHILLPCFLRILSQTLAVFGEHLSMTSCLESSKSLIGIIAISSCLIILILIAITSIKQLIMKSKKFQQSIKIIYFITLLVSITSYIILIYIYSTGCRYSSQIYLPMIYQALYKVVVLAISTPLLLRLCFTFTESMFVIIDIQVSWWWCTCIIHQNPLQCDCRVFH